jgi:hypothetical protein
MASENNTDDTAEPMPPEGGPDVVVPSQEERDTSFRKQLEHLLNSHSRENGCNTPDWILADFLLGCLTAFDGAVNAREAWYGRSNNGPGIAPARSRKQTFPRRTVERG